VAFRRREEPSIEDEREALRAQSEPLEIAEKTTVGDVLNVYKERMPTFGWDAIAVAVNQEYAKTSDVLRDGDEVALLPPVSGGSGYTHQVSDPAGNFFALTRDAIDGTALARQLESRPLNGRPTGAAIIAVTAAESGDHKSAIGVSLARAATLMGKKTLLMDCDPTQSVSQSISPGYSDILPADPLHDEWAYIHGQICVSPAGGVVNFGACAKNDHVNSTVNQNLGANDAAFGLYSATLQSALNSGLYDVMSIDFRMAALTNGYEQLLIFAGNRVPTDVPEPLTITVFGAGLAGVALWRRRRKA